MDWFMFFNDVRGWEPLTSTVVQYKFRLSLVVIDSLNLQIKFLCLKSVFNPRRVEVKRAKKTFLESGLLCVDKLLFPAIHQRGTTNGRMQDAY